MPSAPGALPRSEGGEPIRFSKQLGMLALILGGILLVLFARSFQSGKILFANDYTLGQMKAAANALPGAFFGVWHPGAWLGSEGPAASPTFSELLKMILRPELFLKVYAPFTMLFLGFSAWLFFRQLAFHPAVCLIGGIAAGLNMHFFSIACWGLGEWNMAAAMIFLALAALSTKSIRWPWARALLAGLAVGLNLMEGADVGAILSLYAGMFILWQLVTAEKVGGREAGGVAATAIVVVFCAAMIAAHSLETMIGTQVAGVAGTSQDEQTKESQWDANTRWSLPKLETLRIISPGLFGYSMAARINSPDKSGAYWGAVGRDPKVGYLLDGDADTRLKAANALNLSPDDLNRFNNPERNVRAAALGDLMLKVPAAARFSGSGEYAGLMVVLLALFGAANSFRGESSPFRREERRAAWFWLVAAVFSLAASWGRFAFLYRILYRLPYLSTIRNPVKFLHPFHFALIILAAYGVEALVRQWLRPAASASDILPVHLRKWWPAATRFEKNWMIGMGCALAAAAAAVIAYHNWAPHLTAYMEMVGISAARAPLHTAFSLNEARWFLFWLTLGIILLAGIISGTWNGSARKAALVALGFVIAADLVRSDIPWIHYFDYQTEYSTDTILNLLREKPYEHRVIGRVAPSGVGSDARSAVGQVYNYWQQNEFPEFGIQSLDYAQWPRIPERDVKFMRNFALHGQDLFKCDFRPAERLWQLTGTKYMLLPIAVLQPLQKQAPYSDSIVVKSYVSPVVKPGLHFLEDAGDAMLTPDPKGNYALVENTNILPRAKLYSNWQSPSNDDAALALLASPGFDANQTVLVSADTPAPAPSANGGSSSAGEVEITDYAPKRIRLTATAASPAVLLLNDRMTPQWSVKVDGKAAPLLRCNYLMRGVYLTPGRHAVEFSYHAKFGSLAVSLCAWAAGLATAGLVIATRPKSAPAPAAPAPAPVAPVSKPSPAAAPTARTGTPPSKAGTGTGKRKKSK